MTKTRTHASTITNAYSPVHWLTHARMQAATRAINNTFTHTQRIPTNPRHRDTHPHTHSHTVMGTVEGGWFDGKWRRSKMLLGSRSEESGEERQGPARQRTCIPPKLRSWKRKAKSICIFPVSRAPIQSFNHETVTVKICDSDCWGSLTSNVLVFENKPLKRHPYEISLCF